jgi:hypothetical protein
MALSSYGTSFSNHKYCRFTNAVNMVIELNWIDLMITDFVTQKG